MAKRHDIPQAYYEGRDCRMRGGDKLACPYSHISIQGSWFLAGHNDMDIELSHETQTNGAETQSATGTDPLAA